jgi:hypothetical protein
MISSPSQRYAMEMWQCRGVECVKSNVKCMIIVTMNKSFCGAKVYDYANLRSVTVNLAMDILMSIYYNG